MSGKTSVVDVFLETIQMNGYYGGSRLIKATIKKFFEYCQTNQIKLPIKNFTIRYNSSIPRQVGLAGSSAIVTATMRALMTFYQVEIPIEKLPTLVLSAEVDELGINAGLQDRVIQAYEGCVYMFENGIIKGNNFNNQKRKILQLKRMIHWQQQGGCIYYVISCIEEAKKIFDDLGVNYD